MKQSKLLFIPLIMLSAYNYGMDAEGSGNYNNLDKTNYISNGLGLGALFASSYGDYYMVFSKPFKKLVFKGAGKKALEKTFNALQDPWEHKGFWAVFSLGVATLFAKKTYDSYQAGKTPDHKDNLAKSFLLPAYAPGIALTSAYNYFKGQSRKLPKN